MYVVHCTVYNVHLSCTHCKMYKAVTYYTAAVHHAKFTLYSIIHRREIGKRFYTSRKNKLNF